MERFAAFENAALRARLERLRRAERELQARIDFRIAEAEADGRWVPSDPIYQRLAAVLRQVRRELHDTGREYLRRSGNSSALALVPA
jgi:hypothetical protein